MSLDEDGWVTVEQDFIDNVEVQKIRAINGEFINTSQVRHIITDNKRFDILVNPVALSKVLKDMGDRTSRIPVVRLSFDKTNAKKPFYIADALSTETEECENEKMFLPVFVR